MDDTVHGVQMDNMVYKDNTGWIISSVVPVFKNVGERSTAKNYCPVSLISVVSKAFEKLINNKIVDHLEKFGLFSDFQYGFRSS